MGIDRKADTRAQGAPQRRHSALLEPLAQLGDALCGVDASVLAGATELVIIQTANVGSGSVNGH